MVETVAVSGEGDRDGLDVGEAGGPEWTRDGDGGREPEDPREDPPVGTPVPPVTPVLLVGTPV